MTVRLLSALLVIVLSGCNVLPESESVRLFMLPQSTADKSGDGDPSLPVELRVQSPQTSGVLDSPRIAVVPEGSQINAYKGARWSENAPALLRDRLIEAFIENGQLASVYGDDNRLSADYQLVSRLRAFQSEYKDGEPQVRILLDLHLTDGNGRDVLASQRFEITEESLDEDIEAVVETFGRAADRLSARVVEWTTAQIAEAAKS